MARFGIATVVAQWTQLAFPLGILVVNVLGCFLMGVMLGSRIGERMPGVNHHLGIGFLGSLTTFSTFSADTLRLVHENRIAAAGANVGLNVVVGIIAVAIGYALGRKVGGTL